MGASVAEGWRPCPVGASAPVCADGPSMTRPTQHVLEGTSGCRRAPDHHLGLRVPVGPSAVMGRGRLAQVGGAGTLAGEVGGGTLPTSDATTRVRNEVGAHGLQPETRLFHLLHHGTRWGCSPVSLVSRGEREGGIRNSSPPPLCLGQGSRESKAQGKGTKPALEGCPALGHWNKRSPQAVTGQQCRPPKPPLSSRPSGPLSPRGKQHGHPSAPPQPPLCPGKHIL